MRTGPKRLPKRIPLFLMLFCILFVGGASIANGRVGNSKLNPPASRNHRDTDIAKILSVLEDKVKSRKVTEKIKDKVSNLSDEQTRLIASLAERISNGGQGPGAEIVFFLITILVTV